MVRQTKPGQKGTINKPVRKRKPIKDTTPTLPIDSTFPLATDEIYNKLTPLKKLFVYHYYLKPVTGWNNTKIYQTIRPNVTDTTAPGQASKLLKEPEVQHCIEKLTVLYNERLGYTPERILNELGALSFSDIGDYVDENGMTTINPKNIPASARRAIAGFEEIHTDSGVRYKLKLWDKNSAIKQLVSMQGLAAPTKLDVINRNLEINKETDPKDAARLYAEMLKGAD